MNLERKQNQIIALLLALALVGSCAFTAPAIADAARKITLMPKSVSVKVGKTKKLKLKNNRKKVKWSVKSGAKFVSLKSKKKSGVIVKGKKEGEAVVQAKVGRKKYTCIVTVKAKRKKTDSDESGSVNEPSETDESDDDSDRTDDDSDLTDEPDNDSDLIDEPEPTEPAKRTDINGVPYYDLNIEEDSQKLPYMSHNELYQSYGSPVGAQCWPRKVSSYLNKIDYGYERIETPGKEIYIEEYSDDFVFQSRKTIQIELPIYGGIYSNDKYHYVVCGQKNWGEDNTKEVIRIVQYSKDWERIKAASIYGANTVNPFYDGSVSFAEKDGYIYVRTCHQMYKFEDGKNHQANMTFIFDAEKMEITDQRYEISNYIQSSWGYVSHSFKQEVIADGDDIIAIDHGDGYPRALILSKFSSLSSQYPLYLNDTATHSFVDIMSFRGEIGDAATDASVGNLVASDSSYMVVGDYLMDEKDKRRSIWLSVVPKSNLEANRLLTLTDGTDRVTTPVMIKIDTNKFLIMWNTLAYQNYNYSIADLSYLFVDGEGNRLTDIMKDYSGVVLSDCKPIVEDGKVIWYKTGKNLESNSGYAFDQSGPVFYELDLQDYHIDRKLTCTGFFFKGENAFNEKDYNDIYYIDEKGEYALGLTTIQGKQYLFDHAYTLCTEKGLQEYQDNWYYVNSDYTAREYVEED